MACKLCIAAALHGDLERASGLLAAEVADVQDDDIVGDDRDRVPQLRQLAVAVLSLKAQEKPDKGELLREFLRRMDRQRDANRRETLELRLFAAELLLAAQLQAADNKAADADDIVLLDRLLVPLREREEMLPFLRHYYELLVRAVGKDKPARMADYLLVARGDAQRDPATRVIFHFAAIGDPNPTDNYAIVTPPGEIVPLPFTRQEIRSAANSGDRRLSMPEPLLKLIESEQQAGHSTVLSWDDTKCLSEGNQGLTDEHWKPFAPQLDYATLRKPQ